jgi:hypothetical protein
MKRKIIHEWRNWLLEHIGDDKYELSQKDNFEVHEIIARNAMDAENQCQSIIKKAKKEGIDTP